MRYMPFSSPSLVGLDIQPSDIRLIQLQKSRSGYVVLRTAMSRLPNGVVSDGKVRQWDTFRTVLAALVQTSGVHNLSAAIALPAHLVRMQRVSLPKHMGVTAINTSIKTQVARDFPGLEDALCMDFQVLSEGQEGYQEVFFAAAREEYVSQYVRCVNAAGLAVKIVDVDICALKRMVDYAVPSCASASSFNVILYEVNRDVVLIAHRSNEILLHQQWNNVTLNEFHAQISHHLMMVAAMLDEATLDQFLICSNHFTLYPEQLELGGHRDFNIITMNPFTALVRSHKLEAELDEADMARWMVACGLAMREAPKW